MPLRLSRSKRRIRGGYSDAESASGYFSETSIILSESLIALFGSRSESHAPHAVLSNSSRPISMRRISLVPAPIS